MAKQLAIATIDHGETILDQIKNCVTQCRCFPGVGGDPLDPENDFGDIAIVGVIHATVDGSQHVLQPATLLGRHPGARLHLMTVQTAPQSCQGLDSVETESVKGDMGANWLICPEIIQEDEMNVSRIGGV